jgi:glycosyltransferase involved in cell wall biosynthesis
MNPLRLALVSAFPPGRQSLNEYGLHLAQALACRNDISELVVLADTLDEDLAELDLGPKIRVRRIWRFNGGGSAAALLRALRAERVDGAVYNLQTATFGDREFPAALGLFAPMLTRLAGIPSGIVAHNLIAGLDLEATLLRGQRLRQAAVRTGGAVVTWAMARASYLTVTLRSYADYMQRRYPRANVTLVPHGTFDVGPRRWVPQDERPLRIVTMGKFGTYKRLETLIAAFDILRRQPHLTGVELWIAGSDHPNAPGYLSSVQDARAGDSGIHFAGYLLEDGIPAFFEGARASVFDYESTTGSSGVLHQTASYGAVPVFPAIGDFVDVCRDEGLRGRNYTPGDAHGMARSIAVVLEDAARSETIARANRDAALGMPISEVARFHVEMIRMLRARLPRVTSCPPASPG